MCLVHLTVVLTLLCAKGCRSETAAKSSEIMQFSDFLEKISRIWWTTFSGWSTSPYVGYFVCSRKLNVQLITSSPNCVTKKCMTNYEFEPNFWVSFKLQKSNHNPPCPNLTINNFRWYQTPNERKTTDTHRVIKMLMRERCLGEVIGALINI